MPLMDDERLIEKSARFGRGNLNDQEEGLRIARNDGLIGGGGLGEPADDDHFNQRQMSPADDDEEGFNF